MEYIINEHGVFRCDKVKDLINEMNILMENNDFDNFYIIKKYRLINKLPVGIDYRKYFEKAIDNSMTSYAISIYKLADDKNIIRQSDFIKAIKNSPIDFVQWLRERSIETLDIYSGLETACICDKLDIVKWLDGIVEHKNLNELFIKTVLSDSNDVVKYLYDKYGSKMIEHRFNFFKNVLTNCDIKIVKFFNDITRGDIIGKENELIYEIYHKMKFENLKFFIENYDVDLNKLISERLGVFEDVCIIDVDTGRYIFDKLSDETKYEFINKSSIKIIDYYGKNRLMKFDVVRFLYDCHKIMNNVEKFKSEISLTFSNKHVFQVTYCGITRFIEMLHFCVAENISVDCKKLYDQLKTEMQLRYDYEPVIITLDDNKKLFNIKSDGCNFM